ncbi:hypothetical protein Rhal01_02128 [Rubritalea halochordaticola]|uniref:UPF0145 protein Rhal01_02128 n=2 Tax=Rubritalea halochordaticola TaxID=714537 RepID=A0ABP9V3P2_9BACT
MSWTCKHCEVLNDDIHPACWCCKADRLGNLPGSYESGYSMPCSTTPQIPGKEISETKGVVFGEAIMGANIVRDFAASVRNIVGGRAGAYENSLKNGREIAILEMLEEAKAMGADAVVGIDIDYESINQGMLMICASGTAVTLKD